MASSHFVNFPEETAIVDSDNCSINGPSVSELVYDLKNHIKERLNDAVSQNILRLM